MKKGLFTLGAVLVLLSVGPAWGQTRSFRASVPFPFSIGEQTFPAGNYQFQNLLGKPSRNSTMGMIAIRNLDGRHLYKVVITSLVQSQKEAQSQSKLVFTTYADRSYLARLWTAGDGIGHQLADPYREAARLAADEKEVTLADLR